MRNRVHTKWCKALAVGAVAAGVVGLTGCEAGREFRAAAHPALQTGVTQILNGLLDGIFAVLEPDTGTSGTTGTTDDI